MIFKTGSGDFNGYCNFFLHLHMMGFGDVNGYCYFYLAGPPSRRAGRT